MKLPPKAAAAADGAPPYQSKPQQYHPSPPKFGEQLDQMSKQDFEKCYENQCDLICHGLEEYFGIEVDGKNITDITKQVVAALETSVDPKRIVSGMFNVVDLAEKKWNAIADKWKPKTPDEKHFSASWNPKYVHLHGHNHLLTTCIHAIPLVGNVKLMFGLMMDEKVPNYVICPWCLTADPSKETRAACPIGESKKAGILHFMPQRRNDALVNALLALMLVQAPTWLFQPIAPHKMIRWILMAMLWLLIKRTELEMSQLELLAKLDPTEKARQAALEHERMQAEIADLHAQAAALQARNATLQAEVAASEAEAANAAAKVATVARTAAGLQNRLTTLTAANHRDKAKIGELQDQLGFTQSQLGFTQFQLNGAAAALGRSPEVGWKCPGCGMVNKGTFGYCPHCRSSFTVREMLP